MSIPASASLDACRRWARETLGIPNEAPQAGLRAALFDRVRDFRYAPSEEIAEAVEALAGRPPANDPLVEPGHFHRDREQELLRTVNRLWRIFFSFAPHERRTQWSSVPDDARCYPPLRFRLRSLEAALDLPAAFFADLSPLDSLRLLATRLAVSAPGGRSEAWDRATCGISDARLRTIADIAEQPGADVPGLAALQARLRNELRRRAAQEHLRIANWEEERHFREWEAAERAGARFSDEHVETEQVSLIEKLDRAERWIQKGVVGALVAAMLALLLAAYFGGRHPPPDSAPISIPRP